MQDIFTYERAGIGEAARCWAGSWRPGSGPGLPTGQGLRISLPAGLFENLADSGTFRTRR